MKKISIIIPCYNCANTLPRCLDSVFSQTYQDYEVIAVNDGSADNTLAVLKEYANKHSNLIIIDKQNNGVSSARNDALQIATGDYVQFLDADDNFLDDTIFSENVDLMERYDVDVVVFNFVHPCFQSHLQSGVYNIKDKDEFRKYYQDFFACSMPWNKLFKREHITELYDESMTVAEDEIFNLANLKNINKVYVNNKVCYNYYCAPVVRKEQASAINKIFTEDEFYLKKDTLWYKCVKNKEKRDVIFKQYFSEDMEDYESVRIFDFFFFDFAFMCHLNTASDKMMRQCVDGIAKEEEFLKLLMQKEKYGLKLKSNKINDLQKYMKKFVKLGSRAFEEVKRGRNDMKIYLILFGIFGKCFYETQSDLDKRDILADTLNDLQINGTREALYTNNLIASIA